MEREKVLQNAKLTLRSNDGTEALAYLRVKRKFPDAVIDTFELGYVPSWVTNMYGDSHEFAGRIVIPIRNQYGELVALSSRDWRENAYSKFWHEQFSKSDYLFAINIAKSSIIKNKKAIVAEGEFDIAQMHSHNIKCAVGMLGSVLGLKQISILARYCQEIYAVFDGDEAGLKSLDKTMQMSRGYRLDENYGIRIIPVVIPDKMDPDDFLKKLGRQKFIELLKESKAKDIDSRGEII